MNPANASQGRTYSAPYRALSPKANPPGPLGRRGAGQPHQGVEPPLRVPALPRRGSVQDTVAPRPLVMPRGALAGAAHEAEPAARVAVVARRGWLQRLCVCLLPG